MYGERIRELRIEKKMTQAELAKILNTTQRTISKYEIEALDIGTDRLIQLSIFFDRTTDYILGLEDETGSKTYNNFGVHNGDVNF